MDSSGTGICTTRGPRYFRRGARRIGLPSSSFVGRRNVGRAFRAPFANRGGLSAVVIDEAEGLPSLSGAYRQRFRKSPASLPTYRSVHGTGRCAYMSRLIAALRARMHPDVVAKTIADIQQSWWPGRNVGIVTVSSMINNEISITLVIARCTSTQTGASRWTVRFDPGK